MRRTVAARSRAACSITGEREKDTWANVLGTPLGAREIVLGKILGNLNIAVALFLYWALVMLLRFLCVPSVFVCVPFSLLTGVILMLFCSTLGTYISLASRSTLRAVTTTMVLLVFLGGGYLFCCMPFMVGARDGGGSEFLMAPSAPFLLFVSLSFGNLAKHLGSEFDRMVGPFLIGTFGYAVATAALFSASATRFDALNGRVVPTTGEDTPNWPKEPSPAAADANLANVEPANVEIVDESSPPPPA